MQMIAIALPGVLAVLLCVAALGDVRHYRIPNRLNLAIALLAIPYQLVNFSIGGPDFREILWPQLALIASVFAVMLGLMLTNILGGGDAKLLFALAFWFDPQLYLDMLLLVAIAGGLLSLGILVRRSFTPAAMMVDHKGMPARVRRRQRVPYGVAIAAGALVPASQLILNALMR